MELRDYLRVARRRWRLIVTSLLVVVALAAFLTFQTTPKYESRSRLFVSTSDQTTSEAFQGSNFAIQRITSYANLVNGQELSSRVVKKLGLTMSAATFSSKISASVVPDTVILEITATDPDPLRAQKISQTTASELTGFVEELETPSGQKTTPIKASIVDAASLPTSPVSPVPIRNIGLAIILGLLLGIGLAVLRELLDTTVKTGEDVGQLTQAPVLGGIPYDPQAPKHPLLTDVSTHAPRAEAFRILRTNLQFVDVDLATKVFVVTSSVPGEGKTSTASNTALALQMAGNRTLLIDGDLRRPQLADLFDLEGAVGLTSILLGRIDLDEAVQMHAASGLSVLTSGTLPPNPAELLQSHAMHKLLDAARLDYDMIVIDAPPLLPVTDAALMAAEADGAVVVVRQGRTTRDQVATSMARLTAVGARSLGVTMNMVVTRGRRDYGYGYGYGPQEPKPAKASKAGRLEKREQRDPDEVDAR